MAAVFVVCSRQPLLRHYSRPALGAPQKRRVTIAGSLPLNRTDLPFSRVRKGERALLHPSPFLVRFQPSVLRTYVHRRCYLVEHNVRNGRQRGLVLIFLFLSCFFSLALCLFSGDGDDRTWTRMESFLLAARDPLSRTMKGTPGKKECLPAQPTFP